MLSLGAVAFDPEGEEIGEFSRNLLELPGAQPVTSTMEFWKKNPKAWIEARRDAWEPGPAMDAWRKWLGGLPGKKVAVCYPSGFDFTWTHWYSWRFLGFDPLGFQPIDIKTLAWAKVGGEFRDVVKRKMPKEWFEPEGQHSHLAVEDAREQGKLFFAIKRELGI